MTDQAQPDLTRLPSGEREWAQFIQQAAGAGDLIERHFIELKSEIDPTGKEGAAKIAKFILGAAHRDPDRAAKYLGGYAVMILGVGANDIRGLARFEAKDLVGAVQQYLGEPGPRWDFVRVRADDDHDVIVITAEPPVAGAIWPCCREGVGLADGRIYIRGDGETREANHDEIRALVERVRGAPPGAPLDLDVALNGVVRRYTCDPIVVDEYIAHERQRLEASAPDPRAVKVEEIGRRISAGAAEYFSPGAGTIFGDKTEPDPRSREEYITEIDEWEQEFRTAWPKFVRQVAAIVCHEDPAHIEACSRRWLADVKIKIHLDGPVRADENPSDGKDYAPLPSPPRSWGPRTVPAYTPDFLRAAAVPNMMSVEAPPAIYMRYNSISINNSRSVDLELLVDELRPNDPYVSGDALFLSAPFDHDEPITGQWTATAKDYHQMLSGEVQLELDEPLDLTDFMRDYLFRSDDDDDQDDD
ncbi:hypothetical protein [Mycolicibacterium goodii]|uniref:hypothetical protein n=1 Tax=Mycolicibacterium goodii TaxID=134601 RepID=UPI001BDC3F6F|nr:hypothetical protein [Mycolicibacterium goodii]MBU8833829.1 hypothetical protein [Mycolicibacterium goodii]